MPKRHLTPCPDWLKEFDPEAPARITLWCAGRWGATSQVWELRARQRWLREEWEKHRDWCRMNDVERRDWEASFRNWLRRTDPRGDSYQRPRESARSRSDPRALRELLPGLH